MLNALGQRFDNINYQQITADKLEVQLKNLPTSIYFLELEIEDRFSLFEKFYVR